MHKTAISASENRFEPGDTLKSELWKELDNSRNYDADILSLQEQVEQKEKTLQYQNEQIKALNSRLQRIKCNRLIHARKREIKHLDEKLSELTYKLENKRPKAAIEPFLHQELVPKIKSSAAIQTTSSSYLKSYGFLTAFKAVEDVLEKPSLGTSSHDQLAMINSLLDNDSQTDCKLNWSFGNQKTRTEAVIDEAPPPDLIPQSEKMFSCSTSAENLSMVNFGNLVINDCGQKVLMPTGHVIEPDKITIRTDTLRAAKRRSWADPLHYNHHLQIADSNVGPVPLRSPNQVVGQEHEAERIQSLLYREQQRGRSSVHLSWIFDQPASQEAQNNELSRKSSVEENKTEVVESQRAYLPSSIDAQEEMRENLCENDIKVNNSVQTTIIDHNDGSMRSQVAAFNSITSIEVDSIDKDKKVEQDCEYKSDVIMEVVLGERKNIKGILKNKECRREDRIDVNDETNIEKRRLHFDPLALLLDAALEGELSMVKKCAEEMMTVNQCNGEGITALHNAICAGHYEIVRFLIEAGADVNAQDSDGWTPLHCAASCNNLPTVKFLVEHGACPFAQTLNDGQTPLDKCEEEADGFQGCSQYLSSIQQKMGCSLNGGRVFAAYDRQRDAADDVIIISNKNSDDVTNDDNAIETPQSIGVDELELLNGDELLVVDRAEKDEPGWWLVEKNGVKGWAPRNYLALYPRLKPKSAEEFKKSANGVTETMASHASEAVATTVN